ncbi:MAG: PEGA domain-containing protein, partial [Proteobacteria bacterium]|nr:PEGA domain-containing protein [Pseudomonadota bacterium]
APAPAPAADKPKSTSSKTTTAKSKAKTEEAKPAPKKEEPVAQAAPAPVGNVPGIMQIASKPPCNVIINGKDYGTTPKKIELPAGTYKIKFVNAEQKIDQEQSVTLGAGEVKKVMRKP